MDCKFRAMTEDDYKNIGSFVQCNTINDTYDLVDSASVANTGKNNTVQSLSSANVRQIIKLETPTFNHVLGRSNCNLLARMLGVPSKIWEDVLKCNLIYDLDEDELVDINEAPTGNRYLYGAQIAEKWIKEFDIEEAKLQCLYGAMSAFFRDGVNVKDFVVINKNPSNMFLVADYYAHIQPGADKALKRGKELEDISAGYVNVIFNSPDSRMSYLLNMNPDKSGLYGMLNYYITVVPVELRPKIDNREHKWTKLYTSVVKANFEYRISVSANASPKDMRSKYLSLENATRKLQYKNLGTGPDVKADDLAVLERIKSKKGQIRKNNLGKRRDYSGRAVVSIDPFLPLDHIKIPKTMLPKLYEYHVLPLIAEEIRKSKEAESRGTKCSDNVYDRLKLSNLETPEAQEEILKLIEKYHILDKIPALMGRQPTLHRQSIQAFHVEPSDLQAISVSPCVCPAFNMDFDGDQAHTEVPLSPGAIEEANKLAMVTQNLYLAKNGKITTEPRHEMLYGLYTATRDTYKLGNPVCAYETLEDVRQAVMNHKIKVWDTVKVISTGESILAGDAAFIACFPDDSIERRGVVSGTGKISVMEITDKTISQYVSYILRVDSSGEFVYPIGTGYASNNTFVGCINRLVELGFKVARLYPTSLSLIEKFNDIPEYANANAKFYDNMRESDMYYNLGFETSEAYQVEFNKNLDELNKAKSDNLSEYLGEDNGYMKLSVSGARGSKSNLLQAFSLKGRVMKNSTEVFDALLESAYATQLTPMEHFVDAYGGRQGQIDKSLKTGDTGYSMRKSWHATQGLSITCEDCGTNVGIEVSKKFLNNFVEDSQNEEKSREEIKEMFVHAITGRYRVGSNKVITKREATDWANDDSVHSIMIRSPFTCRKPCCAKCYGLDWCTHKKVVVGSLVGVTAAQSIGEPATQLTMKQFQKGGVAGKAEMTSAFDKADRYMSVADLAELSKKGKYAGYDPIAWATGKIIVKPTSNVMMKKISIEGHRKSIMIPKDVIIKEQAVKGEGLTYVHGDYDIHELLKYTDLKTAQRYLAFKLYSIYKSAGIKMIHFEVLVTNMTRFMVYATDRKDLLVGQYCTMSELYRGDVSNTKVVPNIIGTKSLPAASLSALDTIIMESQGAGLSRSCLLGLHDSLDKPINRMVLGMSIKDGSHTPNFIENRYEKI